MKDRKDERKSINIKERRIDDEETFGRVRRVYAGTRAISDQECGCSGCRNVIASIVMSMLAQLVSRGKIASLSHSLRHRLVWRPA